MQVKPLQPVGNFPPTSLIRRLAAAGYDLFLLIALWMVATFAYLGVRIAISGAEQVQQQSESGLLDGDYLLRLVLLTVSLLFYLSFWTLKGQTLGMQVWRIRVEQPDGQSITRKQAVIRFIAAQAAWLCGGLGLLWMLWDKQSRTWQDIASGTQLVTLPKGTFKN
ncbi:MAG: RDD family protein [Halopseudomonas sp.]